MANPEWVEIFRSFTPEELAEHVTKLKRQISVFSQQSVEGKSYVRDLVELRGQLSAAVRVQNEREGPQGTANYIGVVDFSNLRT